MIGSWQDISWCWCMAAWGFRTVKGSQVWSLRWCTSMESWWASLSALLKGRRPACRWSGKWGSCRLQCQFSPWHRHHGFQFGMSWGLTKVWLHQAALAMCTLWCLHRPLVAGGLRQHWALRPLESGWGTCFVTRRPLVTSGWRLTVARPLCFHGAQRRVLIMIHGVCWGIILLLLTSRSLFTQGTQWPNHWGRLWLSLRRWLQAASILTLRGQACLLRMPMQMMIGHRALPHRAVDQRTKTTKISSRKKRPLRPWQASGSLLSMRFLSKFSTWGTWLRDAFTGWWMKVAHTLLAAEPCRPGMSFKAIAQSFSTLSVAPALRTLRFEKCAADGVLGFGCFFFKSMSWHAFEPHHN